MSADRTRRPSRRLRWVLGAGAALLVIALVAAWFAFRPRADRTAGTEVVRATRDTQTQTVSLSGTVEPKSKANATFKVPGTIQSIDVKVGDTVAAGARLASVGTRDLRDAVTLAQANLSAARAQASSARKASSARAAQVDAADAQVRAAQASLTNARNRLSDATLTAPIAGTIAEVSYDVGDEVAGVSASLPSGLSSGSSGSMGGSTGASGASGLPAGLSGLSGAGSTGSSTGQIVIVATGSWQLNASVGTADLPSLKHGQKASITPTGTSLTVPGTVDTVGIVAEQQSGAAATFPVTIAVDERTDKLFSGSSADAVVTVGTFPDVLTVPDQAVTTNGGASSVQLVRGTVVTTQQVQVGRHFAGRAEITSGLAEGDSVQVPRGIVVTRPPAPAFGPGAAASTAGSPSPTASR